MARAATEAREKRLQKLQIGKMYSSIDHKQKQANIRPVRIQSPREKLKQIIKSSDSSSEEVMTAVESLNKRSVDESPIRLRRRCNSCGRPRGVYRRFGLCRACIRKFFVKGFLPGLVKSSW